MAVFSFAKKKLYFRILPIIIIWCMIVYSLNRYMQGVYTDTMDTIKRAGGIKRAFMPPDFNFEAGDDYFRKERLLNGIDCSKLAEMERSTLNISLFIDRSAASSCRELTTGYMTSSLTAVEEAFPIAYSIMMYKDVAQVWTLLQAIYRPQNLYCLHIDAKSPPEVWMFMRNLVRCFDNVFFSSRSVDVRWSTYTVLEADMICLQDLWNKSATWRYFINLTGQEFPLKTNYELVKILTAYDGANEVKGLVTRRILGRWSKVGDPPDGLLPVKCSTHVALSRKFVEFVLKDAVAKRLLTWSKRVQCPEEVYFGTLHFNPKLGAPGGFWSDNASVIESKPILSRYKIWADWHKPCSGKYVRSICIFDVGDLRRLSISKAMFANKFYWAEGSKVAEYCMAESIYNRTKDEYFGKVTFNDTYYKNLDFVNRQIRPK